LKDISNSNNSNLSSPKINPAFGFESLHIEALKSKNQIKKAEKDSVKEAKKKPKQVSHFFPLTFDFKNPYCSSLTELFEVYTNSIQHIKPSGPTLFSPFLKEMNLFCKEQRTLNKMNYSFLLVITDGVVHDMSETMACLSELEEEGISIVIVGVGNEDFGDMKILDDIGNQEFYSKVKDTSIDSEILELLEKRGERSRDLV
jgi:Copine